MKRYLQLRERFTNRIVRESIDITGKNKLFIYNIQIFYHVYMKHNKHQFPLYICEEIIYG